MQATKNNQILENIIGMIRTITNAIGLGILILMLLTNTIDIIGRLLFNHPIYGAFELRGYMLLLLFALGMAYSAAHDGHIMIEVLIVRFSVKTRNVIKSIMLFCSVGICFLLTWRIFAYAENLRVSGETSMQLKLPLYPFVYLFAIGCAVLCLIFVYKFIGSITQAAKGTGWLVGCGLLLVILLIAFPFILNGGAGNFAFGAIGIVLLLILLFCAMPAGIAMTLAGFLGFAYLSGIKDGLFLLSLLAYKTTSIHVLITIPFLVFITSHLQQSGVIYSLAGLLTGVFGSLPGGTALGGMVASAINSPADFSSQATVESVGSAVLTQNRQLKEKGAFAALPTGSVAAGGTLAILIPPSLIFVLIAILSAQSITKIFLGAVIPGAMIILLFLGCVIILGFGNSHFRFSPQAMSGMQVAAGIISLIIPLFLGMVILALMVSGMMTPGEASGFAALITCILAVIPCLLLKRSILSVLIKAAHQTMQTTGTIILLLIGAAILGHFFKMIKLPSNLAIFLNELDVNRYLVLFAITLIYLFLSCFIEALTLLVLSIPILFATIYAFGLDPTWFGVYLTFLVGMGVLLPPVGDNLRIAQRIDQEHSKKEIIRSVLPFLLLMILMLGLVAVFPQLVLWLPTKLF